MCTRSCSRDLCPHCPLWSKQPRELFTSLATAVRNPGEVPNTGALDAVTRALEADLAQLREQRATAPLALDRMLPFWALVFNLREVAQDLRQLQSILPKLV